MTKKLPKLTFEYIKKVLKDYPDIDNHIKQRKEQLKYPHKTEDVNSDIKSNKQTDNMANMMITIDEDKMLGALQHNKRVVEYNLDQSDKDTEIIIREVYIRRYKRFTIEGLVTQNKIKCGRTKAHELRDNFFRNVAIDLNLPLN